MRLPSCKRRSSSSFSLTLLCYLLKSFFNRYSIQSTKEIRLFKDNARKIVMMNKSVKE
jgi:hypothetical protein